MYFPTILIISPIWEFARRLVLYKVPYEDTHQSHPLKTPNPTHN